MYTYHLGELEYAGPRPAEARVDHGGAAGGDRAGLDRH